MIEHLFLPFNFQFGIIKKQRIILSPGVNFYQWCAIVTESKINPYYIIHTGSEEIQRLFNISENAK